MKARVQGAERLRVDSGQAFHSPRKVLLEPALHLATGGFPREASWNRDWQASYRGPRTLRGLCDQITHPEVLKAVRIREEHLLALLGVLPLHVDRALGESASSIFGTEELATKILPLLPLRTDSDLQSRPGVLISDVFDLISSHGEQLLNHARQIISEK